MLNKPLISIITPTYNHEDFIGDCIDSLLKQDYQNWEQIIIDDGSTDSTERINIKICGDEKITIKKYKNFNSLNWNKKVIICNEIRQPLGMKLEFIIHNEGV